MKKIYFIWSGIILFFGQVLVRILVNIPPNRYTNLNVILDVSFVVGIVLIVIGLGKKDKDSKKKT